MIYLANIKYKRALVTELSGKADFKTKSISRDKEGYLRVIKRPLHQEDIATEMDVQPQSFKVKN